MATARISSASAAAHGKRRVHGRVRRVSVVRGCAGASSAFPEYGGRVGEKESLGKRVKRALKGVKEKLRERAAKNAEVRADPAVVKSTRKTMKDVYIFRSILPLCASVAAAGPEAFDINYMIKGMCMTLSRFLELYSIILILKILISWFPNVDISMEPFKTLDQITEPFFLLFRYGAYLSCSCSLHSTTTLRDFLLCFLHPFFFFFFFFFMFVVDREQLWTHIRER